LGKLGKSSSIMIRTKKELNDRALHNEDEMPTQQLGALSI